MKIDEDRNIEEIKLEDANVDKLVSWNDILAKDGKNIYTMVKNRLHRCFNF